MPPASAEATAIIAFKMRSARKFAARSGIIRSMPLKAPIVPGQSTVAKRARSDGPARNRDSIRMNKTVTKMHYSQATSVSFSDTNERLTTALVCVTFLAHSRRFSGKCTDVRQTYTEMYGPKKGPKSMKLDLNDRFIAGLKPGDKPLDYFDAKCRGLNL